MFENKRITKATLKSFLKNHQDNIYINETSSFDSFDDMVSSINNGFKKVDFDLNNHKNTLGYEGIWLVGKDFYKSYDDDKFTGIEYSNCCGSAIIAILK
jgi:hypothetical protein